MSDPLTTLDFTIVTTVVVALAAVIATLWKVSQRAVNDLRTTVALQRKEMEEVVKRLRDLEQERFNELKKYANRLEDLNRQQISVFGRVVTALQNITTTVSECLRRWDALHDAPDTPGANAHRTPLPQIDTETLLKADDRIKARHQEESARS